MKNKLLFGVLILIALGIGYLIGSKTSQPASISTKIDSELGALQDKQIIPINKARKYHQNLKDFLKKPKLDTARLKEFLTHPITIDSAKENFMEIFSQDSVSGLRMYPGLSYDRGKPEITFVFIATKGDSGDYVYKKNERLPGGTIAKEESAKVQDNNRPCNPCTLTRFSKYSTIP